jgi:hypothetical protein
MWKNYFQVSKQCDFFSTRCSCHLGYSQIFLQKMINVAICAKKKLIAKFIARLEHQILSFYWGNLHVA